LAEYRRVAFRELRVIVAESALLYLLIRTARGKQHTLLRLVDVLWLSGVGVALYALARHPFAEGVIEAEAVRRARAFYGSPNNLALYLERLLPLGLAVAVWGQGRARRWVYGLGALLIALALFLTYSRGALFLGVPAMLLTLAWVRGGRTRWIVPVALVAVLLVLVLWVGPMRLSSLLDPSQGTTFLRLSLWQAAWEMGKDHPWLGVGLDNFLYYYGDYIRPGAEVDRWLSHPHNLVLDFWLRLGIGGVALILAMLARFARKAFATYRALPEGDLRAMTMGLMAGMTACVAHGLIDSSFFVVELAFWFMLALSWVGSLYCSDLRT
jgi:O-antigen ligase